MVIKRGIDRRAHTLRLIARRVRKAIAQCSFINDDMLHLSCSKHFTSSAQLAYHEMIARINNFYK